MVASVAGGPPDLIMRGFSEPLRGTKAHVGELLDRCTTATELVDALAGT